MLTDVFGQFATAMQSNACKLKQNIRLTSLAQHTVPRCWSLPVLVSIICLNFKRI